MLMFYLSRAASMMSSADYVKVQQHVSLWRLFCQSLSAAKVYNDFLTVSTTMGTTMIPAPLISLDLLEGKVGYGKERLWGDKDLFLKAPALNI